MSTLDLSILESEVGSPEPTHEVECLSARPLADLQTPTHDDPGELLRYRFLCRGGGLLLCGPTGIGKSSLALQMLLCWSLGKPCFDLRPANPIKSLLIQAENDDGDLAEIRDGVTAGLHFTPNDRQRAPANVHVASVDDRTGADFIRGVVESLVSDFKPDLVCLDPLLAYLGGDVSKQETVSAFLRNQLNPVLHRHGCAVVLVHHTNKPPSGREKPDWQAGDFAYLGAGSADLANWARAVVALRSIGQPDVFELRLGKRGRRAGWHEADGVTVSYVRHIAHAKEPGVICWRDAARDEIPSVGGRPQAADVAELVKLLDGQLLTTSEWQRMAKEELGISRPTFFRRKDLALGSNLVSQSKIDRKWFKTA